MFVIFLLSYLGLQTIKINKDNVEKKPFILSKVLVSFENKFNLFHSVHPLLCGFTYRGLEQARFLPVQLRLLFECPIDPSKTPALIHKLIACI